MKSLGKVDLSADTREFPDAPGIYFLCLGQGIRYDKGFSPILYIGSTKSFRDRLKNHRSSSHNLGITLLQQKYQKLIFCDLYEFSALNRDQLYAVEESALREFHRVFGVLPLLNAAVPAIAVQKRLKCPFRFQEPNSNSILQPSDLIDQVYGLEFSRNVITPADFNNVDFISDEEFNSFRLPTKWDYREEQEKIRYEKLNEEEKLIEDKRTDPQYRMLTILDVASWDVPKIVELIEVSKRLKKAKYRSERVFTYVTKQANLSDHLTWGEVAVILARSESGGWIADHGVEYKIRNSSEVLGRASGTPLGFFGWDEGYDLQRHRPRSSDITLELLGMKCHPKMDVEKRLANFERYDRYQEYCREVAEGLYAVAYEKYRKRLLF